MSKIPKNPEEILPEFTDDFKNIYGNDLISIILYGSAAKEEYKYKKSDINFLIILTENGIDQLSKCLPLIPKWRKRNVNVPLFLTREYINSALDTFPIEFLDMTLNHKLVFGEDVLEKIQIEEEDLRLQCEREVRGKLLQLRENFLLAAPKQETIKMLINQSLAAFSSIFIALLKLKDVEVPAQRRDIFLKTADVFGLDRNIFEQLLAIRENKQKLSRQQLITLMEEYIREIRKLTQKVDQL